MSLQTISIIYFAAFLIFLIIVAIWAARQKSGGNTGAATEHFLGGKTTPMFVLAMSYCASAVSAGSFIGDPALMAEIGWPYFWQVIFLVPGLVIPGFFIIRKLRLQSEKYGVMTINEYYGARFKSPFLQLFIAIVILFCFSVILVAQFKAASILLGRFTGLDFVPCLIVIAAVVLFYTNTGGLRSVAWTDFFQGLLMCVLCIILIATGLVKVGGFGGLETSLGENWPDMLNIIQTGPEAQVGIMGIFGFFLFDFFAMFSLPYITSRYIALKEVSRKSVGQFLLISLVTGILFNLMFINGLVGKVLFPEAPSDYLTITMSTELVTPVVAGLLMVGFFSAIISTATSILLVVGQCTGRDIYGYFWKNAPEANQVKVSNITNIVVMLLVVVFNLYKTPALLQIFIFIGMTGVGSACCAPLFCGVLWDKATREGAIASAIAGPVSYVIMMHVFDVNWVWGMGAAVLWAFGAMFAVSWVVHKTRGNDMEMVTHASVETDEIS